MGPVLADRDALAGGNARVPAMVSRRFFCFGLFWHALDIVWIGVFTTCIWERTYEYRNRTQGMAPGVTCARTARAKVT